MPWTPALTEMTAQMHVLVEIRNLLAGFLDSGASPFPVPQRAIDKIRARRSWEGQLDIIAAATPWALDPD